MNIELGKLGDGGLVLMADAPFSHPVACVQYYSDQRLLMLVFDAPDHEGDLMHYELAERAAEAIRARETILVVSTMPRRGLGGREVPLVHIN